LLRCAKNAFAQAQRTGTYGICAGSNVAGNVAEKEDDMAVVKGNGRKGTML